MIFHTITMFLNYILHVLIMQILPIGEAQKQRKIVYRLRPRARREN